MPSTFTYLYPIIIIMSPSPAQYCKNCTFPFKQMGACPYPDKTMLWAYLSMVPYVLLILIPFIALIFRKMSQFKLFCLAASAYIFGDKILKKLIRNPRPHFSCKSSYGMPSSHMTVMTAISFYRILDPEVSLQQKAAWVLITVAEGFARTELNYHTVEQVLAGVLFAIIYALIFLKLWEIIVVPLIRKYFDEEYGKPSDHQCSS